MYRFENDEDRKLKLLYERSGINERYAAIDDFFGNEAQSLFQKNTTPPSTAVRMEKYFQTAPQMAQLAVEKAIAGHIKKQEITHLITVSCTGMAAPGLDILLVENMGLNADISRTSVNFMGCYAAIHGLKLAHLMAQSDKNAKIVMVCVELCSLHFQNASDWETIAANLLFADGAAAALVTGDDYTGSHECEILDFYSKIHLSGKNDMAWNISDTGFLMSLSSYIPKLIESGVKELVSTALEKHHLSVDDISSWAIHPGGRKILEIIQTELKLDVKHLKSSYEILYNYGNMSSPTVLFVLKDILEAQILDQSKSNNIFMMAFGPGITMETAVLKK